MIKFEIEKIFEGGVLKEDSFRERIRHIAWDQYRGQDVLIKGCSSTPIPTWAYLIVAVQLAHHAKAVFYGEEKSPNLVCRKDLRSGPYVRNEADLPPL